MFLISFWSYNDRFQETVPRIDNSVEGWHLKLNIICNGAHPAMWKCIELLQQQQVTVEIEIEKVKAGLQEKKEERIGALMTGRANNYC